MNTFPAVANTVRAQLPVLESSFTSNLAATSREPIPCENDLILVERLLQAWNSGDGRESSGTPQHIRSRWISGDLSGTEIEMQRINRICMLSNT